MPNFKFNMDFVPIPKDFVEHIMPSSNASYVMVYIYFMLLATTGKTLATGEIAKKLGLIESDVINAIKYWTDKGILAEKNDTVIIKKSVDEDISIDTDKKSIDDIEDIISGNKTLSDLCLIAQEILGKTLASNDIETLYWFYDELGFSPEVITMLLEYCASIGKRNMKYIEKVAITWRDNNISTMDEAQSFITKISSNNSSGDDFISSLQKLLGITDRKLSKNERLFIENWRNTLNMSADMIVLAYEYCIIAIGKLSFPYMNSILSKWAELGIRTIQEAEKEHESFKQNNYKNNTEDIEQTANISEIEQQFMNNYDLD